jgi:hypothetical protein
MKKFSKLSSFLTRGELVEPISGLWKLEALSLKLAGLMDNFNLGRLETRLKE